MRNGTHRPLYNKWIFCLICTLWKDCGVELSGLSLASRHTMFTSAFQVPRRTPLLRRRRRRRPPPLCQTRMKPTLQSKSVIFLDPQTTSPSVLSLGLMGCEQRCSCFSVKVRENRERGGQIIKGWSNCICLWRLLWGHWNMPILILKSLITHLLLWYGRSLSSVFEFINTIDS